MGVSQIWGYLLGGLYDKDYSILGSILGSPYFGKLSYSPATGVDLRVYWRFRIYDQHPTLSGPEACFGALPSAYLI